MAKQIKPAELADVATKGGVLGVISYLFSTYNVDPALNIVVLPAVMYVLNALSTKVGDPQVANFFAKQSKVVEVAVKQTVAKPVTKAVAKTTPKKKAPATFTKNSDNIPARVEPRVSSSPLPIAYLSREPIPPPRKTRNSSFAIRELPRDELLSSDIVF